MKQDAGRAWTAQSPYDRFYDFISPKADRFAVLLDHINSLALNSMAITINNNQHLLIFPHGINLKSFARGSFPFKGRNPVVLAAHYDRVPGSPGANDNSAAVFQLLKAAIRLGKLNIGHWIIIFTDKEELQSGEGIHQQGSYSLAKKLRDWGLAKARVFNFDACGTGDTFIFSSTTDYLMRKNKKQSIRRASETLAHLREKTQAAARQLKIKKTLSLPVPFSDDAGFLKGGIPAQTITMLPAAEAGFYASLLEERPGFADMIIAGSVQSSDFRQLLPETWRCLNGPLDSPQRLTPEHYERIVRFAVELCKN